MVSGGFSFSLPSCIKGTKVLENVVLFHSLLIALTEILLSAAPAHLHPLHHDFPKLQVVTELPRLAA